MTPFLLILITIFGTVASQLLIKAGVLSLSGTSTLVGVSPIAFFMRAITSPMIIGGLVAAFFGAISWIFAMKAFPLNFAYPFTALTIVLVIFLSTYVFKEETNPFYWVSVAMIVGGVILLVFSRPQ